MITAARGLVMLGRALYSFSGQLRRLNNLVDRYARAHPADFPPLVEPEPEPDADRAAYIGSSFTDEDIAVREAAQSIAETGKF